MARLLRSSRSLSKTGRHGVGGKTLPIVLLGQAAVVLRDHWRNIPTRDRARLAELLKASKGRPGNLTPAQRTELSAIVKRADISGLTRDLAPLASRRATHRGFRR